MREAEINYSSNLYKTHIFGIIKTDELIELNESFGFRVKIDLDPNELLKFTKGENSYEEIFNYNTTPFYLEAHLYSLKCKF
mmetsp:Transcript_4885/g.4133  ORF Transcript_4885/g.4133 Transcript_4885/m.4133 type:complete len:81 (+) Transcript_4885:209-451(+)